jgi:hypothetical protein
MWINRENSRYQRHNFLDGSQALLLSKHGIPVLFKEWWIYTQVSKETFSQSSRFRDLNPSNYSKVIETHLYLKTIIKIHMLSSNIPGISTGNHHWFWTCKIKKWKQKNIIHLSHLSSYNTKFTVPSRWSSYKIIIVCFTTWPHQNIQSSVLSNIW